MVFDSGDHLSASFPPLESEVISLSQRPQVRFGLGISSSGLICSIASDSIYLLRPILHDLGLKFQLFSQKFGNDQRLTTPFKLVPYISARRWKQRAVSEVELQSTQMIHQLGMNIQLGKFMLKKHDFSGKTFYLLSETWSKSVSYLLGGFFVSVITSQDTSYVYNCNSDESGLILENFPHHLYSDPHRTHIFPIEPFSRVLWTDSYEKMHKKINFVSFVSVNWSNIFLLEDGTPFLFLGCGTKDGRLLIWKINNSNTSSFEDYELVYEKYFHSNLTWINILSWSDNFTNRSTHLAICSTDGTVDVILLNSHSNELSTYNLYSERDCSVVKAILWENGLNEDNTLYLFLIKGSYLFMFSLSLGYSSVTSLENHFIYINISHTSAVASIAKLFRRYIVVGYIDFKFSIYDNQSESYLKLLTRESEDLSNFIYEYSVRLTNTNFIMHSFTFSTNSLYIIIVGVGPLIGCGRPSKFDISLRNKILFIPIITIPIIIQSIQPFISDFVHWDLIKLYLFEKSHQTCEIMSSFLSSLTHVIKTKLEYIFNYLNCSANSLSAIVYLLIQFNSNILLVAGSNFIPENDVHNCLLQYQQNLLNSKVEAINLEACEACGSPLKIDFSEMYYICVNDHKSAFCIFTLKKINLAGEYMHCILCRKKILKTAMKELSSLLPNIFIITCPLCDGLFIDS